MSTPETNSAEPRTPASMSRTLNLFFFAVAFACAALAFHMHRARNEALGRLRELEQAAGSGRTAGRAHATVAGRSTQDYELLAHLARKDATIADLRRRLGLPPGETVGATNRSSATRYRPSPRFGERTTNAGQAQSAPAPSAASTAKRAAGDLSELQKFLGSIDASKMTTDQYERHARLIERVNVLQDLLKQARAAPDETQQRELDQQVENRLQGIDAALQDERNILFYTAGLQLGYDDSSAQWFADYVKYVYQITSPDSVSNSVWRASTPQ